MSHPAFLLRFFDFGVNVGFAEASVAGVSRVRSFPPTVTVFLALVRLRGGGSTSTSF
ncbi:hypothetical protein PF003_g19208 [Phytophthora fragariae]|nr:hypothetical protein PF003_g19208 [Phytophthora fragariae]